jgi:hypothetical protein
LPKPLTSHFRLPRIVRIGARETGGLAIMVTKLNAVEQRVSQAAVVRELDCIRQKS